MTSSTAFTGELGSGLSAALETIINNALKLDAESMTQLGAFEGRLIQLKLEGLALDFYLLPSKQGIHLMQQSTTEADAVLAGRPVKFAEMVLGDASKVLFSGDVVISGDVELGQNFKRWLDGLNLDWEEHLSTFTGDIVAHKTATLMRNAGEWGLNAMTILRQNTADYLQQESEQLPMPGEVDDFMQQVDEFRDATERLEAHLAQLKIQLSP